MKPHRFSKVTLSSGSAACSCRAVRCLHLNKCEGVPAFHRELRARSIVSLDTTGMPRHFPATRL